MTGTTVVELTVVGSVDVSDVSDADLAELGVRRATVCTLLEATVRDQAALYGLLQRLASLGLDLLELRTAAPGARADVEVVVRGPVGALVQEMLRDVSRSVPAAVTSYRVRDTDLAGLLAVVDGIPSPSMGEDTHGARGHRGSAGLVPGLRRVATTEERAMDRALDEMGPIDYLVVEFPENRLDGEALPLLVELVDRGIIRVLDLAFVEKNRAGEVSGIELRDLDSTGDFDVSVFEGASSGLLGDDDLEEAGAALEPGSAAGVLVYENAWAAPFASALRRGGGTVVAGGRIPVQSIVAALDAVESR
ncbi:DUF6325 family protein [Cellulosimicrobium sp. Marseille-Q4280]|uniref:DUF6325 family protein n=1 Tax=Cellulosimicrobium sp. Marseille-Q4280 TaxID=2937992 RepID=UPI00204163C5|nr:DUF6325 family protein [Cellulosimicrobium sp. Marseille-Q4280]